MQSLFKQYVKLVLEAVSNEENVGTDSAENEGDEINEFSGVGAIAGYTLPLGASKEDLENPSPRRKKRRKQDR